MYTVTGMAALAVERMLPVISSPVALELPHLLFKGLRLSMQEAETTMVVWGAQQTLVALAILE